MKLTRIRAGVYAGPDHILIQRYDNDVTGRGVEWVATVGESWVATARTKREAVAALDGTP